MVEICVSNGAAMHTYNSRHEGFNTLNQTNQEV